MVNERGGLETAFDAPVVLGAEFGLVDRLFPSFVFIYRMFRGKVRLEGEGY